MLEIIFTKIYLKIYLNLINISEEPLSFDQCKRDIKIYILNCVLEEIKSFLINDLYYRSKNLNFNFESDKFFELVLLRVRKTIRNEVQFLKDTAISYSEFNWVVKYLETEDGELLNLVLKLVPLNNYYETNSFIYGFDRIKLITSLLENFVIKLSNVFIYVIFFNFGPKQLVYRGIFYSNIYVLKNRKNNFYWQAYLASTFLKPKYMYYNLYSLKVLNKYGISSKVVYIPNLDRKEKYTFSSIQLAVLFYFELIDFLYPKVFRIIQNSQEILKLIFK